MKRSKTKWRNLLESANPISASGNEYADARYVFLTKKLNSINSPLSEEINSFSRDITVETDYKSTYGIHSRATYALSPYYDDIDDLKNNINLTINW